jgi:hypothetical protein
VWAALQRDVVAQNVQRSAESCSALLDTALHTNVQKRSEAAAAKEASRKTKAMLRKQVQHCVAEMSAVQKRLIDRAMAIACAVQPGQRGAALEVAQLEAQLAEHTAQLDVMRAREAMLAQAL